MLVEGEPPGPDGEAGSRSLEKKEGIALLEKQGRRRFHRLLLLLAG